MMLLTIYDVIDNFEPRGCLSDYDSSEVKKIILLIILNYAGSPDHLFPEIIDNSVLGFMSGWSDVSKVLMLECMVKQAWI